MYYRNNENYYSDNLDKRKVMVSIHCIAYNQEKYIRDTLDGFVMQKTDFPFVAVVHDDASTDNTASIIREYAEKYPDIIKPIFETENQYRKPGGPLQKIMLQAINATGAKYVAYCEGDDYWTDPLKLQKQVDFLESHPDYSFVCCNADYYIQKYETLRECQYKKKGTFGIEYLIYRNFIETCTVMTSVKYLNSFQLEFPSNEFNLSFGDYQLWLYLSTKGKCMRLSDTMAIYRLNSGGVSNLTDNVKKIKWMRSIITVIDYFSTNYKIEEEAKKRSYFTFFRHWAFFAATVKDITVYERAIKFYAENGYFWTKIFLKCARHIQHPKKFWAFINAHNRIKPVITKSYDPA